MWRAAPRMVFKISNFNHTFKKRSRWIRYRIWLKENFQRGGLWKSHQMWAVSSMLKIKRKLSLKLCLSEGTKPSLSVYLGITEQLCD